MNLGSNLLPGRFVQHLRILRWVVVVHVVQIEEAARGNLAPGKDPPSEEEALECLIRIFEGSHAETDRRLIEAYMAARTWEWWQGYPERRLFSDLAERADHRKRWTGTRDSRRPPSREEGLRVARPLLAGIPDEITLDAMGEYESAARLLGSLLLPPMGEPSPEKLQVYTELAESMPLFRDSLGHYYKSLDNADAAIFRPGIGWQQSPDVKPRHLRDKVQIQAHSPVKPAEFVRNLQMQFVIGLLGGIRIPPYGRDAGGCSIVAEILGLSQDRVEDLWEMCFFDAMIKNSRAIAIRLGLHDSTED